MVNTEKPIGKTEQKRQGIVSTPKENKQNAAPVKTIPKKDDTINKKEDAKDSQENLGAAESKTLPQQGTDKDSAGKKEEKKPIQKKPKIKKTEAIVNAYDLHISTKYSVAICKFIKGKKIDKALSDLEQVLSLKKAVPMRGEIAHRKGKIMSGKFPKKATENFIKVLKSLQANANFNEIDDPIIVEAIANLASRPYGKFGRVRKKRTHVKVLAKKKTSNKLKKKKKRKNEITK